MKRNRLMTILAINAGLAAGTVTQLLPSYKASANPPTGPGGTIETRLKIPTSVRRTLQKACQDCHSNETHWPWYSRVPPASYLVKRDVEHGRRAMNFSEWSQQTGNRAGRVAGLLTAACADVQSGRMPMYQYRLMHAEANLAALKKLIFAPGPLRNPGTS